MNQTAFPKTVVGPNKALDVLLDPRRVQVEVEDTVLLEGRDKGRHVDLEKALHESLGKHLRASQVGKEAVPDRTWDQA